MGTDWIEQVMKTNAAIVAAEARANAQLADVLVRLTKGEDTTESERLHIVYGRDLVWLRAIQAQHLQSIGAGA